MKALKVKIGLKPNGQADYPKFGLLPAVQASGMDWSNYIDMHGHGWQYDCCGHQDVDAESPRGMQWGMLIVPDAFADEAAAMFPDTCAVMTEAVAEAFFDNRVARERDEEITDTDALTALHAELELVKASSDAPEPRGLAMRKTKPERILEVQAKIDRALDPDDPARGKRRNHDAKWSTFKAKCGIELS